MYYWISVGKICQSHLKGQVFGKRGKKESQLKFNFGLKGWFFKKCSNNISMYLCEWVKAHSISILFFSSIHLRWSHDWSMALISRKQDNETHADLEPWGVCVDRELSSSCFINPQWLFCNCYVWGYVSCHSFWPQAIVILTTVLTLSPQFETVTNTNVAH